MHDEIPDNLLLAGFNYIDKNPYSLINILSENIRTPFKILKYYSQNNPKSTNIHPTSYAVFYANISYFNTHLFLLKNFSFLDENHLFSDKLPGKMHYLLPLKPPKMYILSIYSDEVKNIEDINRLLKLNTLHINPSPIHTKRVIQNLHFSFYQWIENGQ